MGDDSDCSGLAMGDLAMEQLAKYARFLEVAFVRCGSQTLGNERLRSVLSEARELICPDAVDYLGSVRATVDRWASVSPILAMCSGRRQAVPLWDILFLTREDGEPLVQTERGRYHCSISLDRAEVMLEAKGFVRSHRSFLVNISHATSVDDLGDGSGIVRFGVDGVCAKVSRRKLNEVQAAFGRWRREVVPTWQASHMTGR